MMYYDLLKINKEIDMTNVNNKIKCRNSIFKTREKKYRTS